MSVRKERTAQGKAWGVQCDGAAPASKPGYDKAVPASKSENNSGCSAKKMPSQLREFAEESWKRHKGSYRYLRDR